MANTYTDTADVQVGNLITVFYGKMGDKMVRVHTITKPGEIMVERWSRGGKPYKPCPAYFNDKLKRWTIQKP